MSDLLTLKEELDRKVLETIEWLFVGLDRGQISQEQFSTGIDALFMAVSGLVGGDFIHLISEAQKQLEDMPKPSLRRHFFNGSNTSFQLSWQIGDNKVVITRIVGGCLSKSSVVEKDTAQEARDSFNRSADSLLLKGFWEL